MELYFQFGYGMKAITCELANSWGGGTVILSPRDMDSKSLRNWCNEFRNSKLKMLFDPQCYFPKGDSKKLSTYSYWNSDMQTFLEDKSKFDFIIEEINQYNEFIGTDAYLIPSFLDKYSDKWFKKWIETTEQFIGSTRRIVKNKPVIATLALPSGFLIQSEDKIEQLINKIQGWNVDGYYIVAETPEHSYLVSNEIWLSNVFNICAALKTTRRKVIFGYANHQMLPLSIFKVDAIASGTWLNVRSFTNRFDYQEPGKKRSTWIYYPHSLSEYRLNSVDASFKDGFWKTLELDPIFSNKYSNAIYNSEVSPGSILKPESISFKFYLSALREQAISFSRMSHLETYHKNVLMINEANRISQVLFAHKLNGDYKSIFVYKEAVCTVLKETEEKRGFTFEMMWDIL